MNQVWPKAVAQSLPDQVARVIVQKIASGRLSTGHKLPSQRQLAREMGVGLAVVREAVKRLEALNIVGAAHGSGTVVLPFRWMPLIYDPSLFVLAATQIGIRDLWETRRLLEVQIVRLVAERATRENLAEIRAVLDRANPVPLDYAVSQELNREFHMTVAKGCQNAVMIDLLAPLVDVHVEGISHHFTEEMSRRTWAAHEAIYAALAARRPDEAEAAMRHHFTIGPIAVEADGDKVAITPPPQRRATAKTPRSPRRS
jgi:GntR family transcriptional repressor for pyruvate dehydrogenase complex